MCDIFDIHVISRMLFILFVNDFGAQSVLSFFFLHGIRVGVSLVWLKIWMVMTAEEVRFLSLTMSYITV